MSAVLLLELQLNEVNWPIILLSLGARKRRLQRGCLNQRNEPRMCGEHQYDSSEWRGKIPSRHGTDDRARCTSNISTEQDTSSTHAFVENSLFCAEDEGREGGECLPRPVRMRTRTVLLPMHPWNTHGHKSELLFFC